MQKFATTRVCLVSAALCISRASAHAPGLEEALSGPDSHATGQGPHGHLFGNCGGVRSHLSRRGVRLEFQYISDSRSNPKSEQPERFALVFVQRVSELCSLRSNSGHTCTPFLVADMIRNSL